MALQDYRKLNPPFQNISTLGILEQKILNNPVVANLSFEEKVIYFPLQVSANKKYKISKRQFVNCSFSKTTINMIHFEQCKFEDCLFEFTKIENCEFHRCTFEYVNTHKIEFRNTYIDPNSFKNFFPPFDYRGHFFYFIKQFYCNVPTKPNNYANVKTHLYQMLLENSAGQVQPDFVNDAKFFFRKSQRGLYVYRLLNNQMSFSYFIFRYIKNLLYYSIGYGVRTRYFFLTYAIFIGLVTRYNYKYWNNFDLQCDICNGKSAGAPTFLKSLFYSVYTTTTVGSDVYHPKSDGGLEAMMFQGILGYLLLAIFAALLINKFIK